MKKVGLENKILNVYKPPGLTSYDVVRFVKRLTGIKKVGHGGTLDPFAEGVLLVMTGRATKKMNELLKYPKVYEAILQLGCSTDTGDPEGKVVEECSIPDIDESLLKNVENEFTGEIIQRPPKYSAKKIDGIPAYKYVRKGIEVNLASRKVNIYKIELRKLGTDRIFMLVECSSGTYIRRLGEDIAKCLGTCGYLVFLRRTKIGPYKVEDAITLDELRESYEKNLISGESGKCRCSLA